MSCARSIIVLASVIAVLGIAGCAGDKEGASSPDAMGSTQPKADHPKGDHPKGDHPSGEHPK